MSEVHKYEVSESASELDLKIDAIKSPTKSNEKDSLEIDDTDFVPTAILVGSDSRLAFIVDLFRWRGTIIADVMPQILLGIAMAFAGKVADRSYDFILPPTAHNIAGILLGFLLVFRTNFSYDRYYDGLARLSQFSQASMKLFQIICSVAEHFPEAKQLRMAYRARLNLLFALVRQHIRESKVGFEPSMEEQLGDFSSDSWHKDKTSPKISRFLKSDDIKLLSALPPSRRPLAICVELQQGVTTLCATGRLAPDLLRVSLEAIGELIDHWKYMNSIVLTPIPFPFMHMLNLILFCFVYSTAFTLENFGWYTAPLAMFIVSLGFYGIQAIGVEIENPFGWDVNDHNLESFGCSLAADLQAIQRLRDHFVKSPPEYMTACGLDVFFGQSVPEEAKLKYSSRRKSSAASNGMSSYRSRRPNSSSSYRPNRPSSRERKPSITQDWSGDRDDPSSPQKHRRSLMDIAEGDEGEPLSIRVDKHGKIVRRRGNGN